MLWEFLFMNFVWPTPIYLKNVVINVAFAINTSVITPIDNSIIAPVDKSIIVPITKCNLIYVGKTPSGHNAYDAEPTDISSIKIVL